MRGWRRGKRRLLKWIERGYVASLGNGDARWSLSTRIAMSRFGVL